MSVRSQCTKSVSRMIATRGPSAYPCHRRRTRAGERGHFDAGRHTGGARSRGSSPVRPADTAGRPVSAATGLRWQTPLRLQAVASLCRIRLTASPADRTATTSAFSTNWTDSISIRVCRSRSMATSTRRRSRVTRSSSCPSPDFDNETLADRPAVSVIGLNQIVWDPETRTLHARSDDALEEHTRYALVVTRGVLDASGQPIHPSDRFANYRHLLAISGDEVLIWYRDELIRAEHAARVAGVRPGRPRGDQSVPHAELDVPGPPDPRPGLNRRQPHRGLRPRGRHEPRRASRSSASPRSRSTGGLRGRRPCRRSPASWTTLRFVPGAGGGVAFGRYEFAGLHRVHPGEYLPAVPTPGGAPVRRGTETVYFNLYLRQPARRRQPRVAGRHRRPRLERAQEFHAGHGYVGPGRAGRRLADDQRGGPRVRSAQHAATRFRGRRERELPAGGRSVDQNGDGRIAVNEGFRAGAATPSGTSRTGISRPPPT